MFAIETIRSLQDAPIIDSDHVTISHSLRISQFRIVCAFLQTPHVGWPMGPCSDEPDRRSPFHVVAQFFGSILLAFFRPFQSKIMSKKRAAADVQSNRERLLDMSRGSYLSHRALEAIVEDIRQRGIPEHSSRTTQARYRKESARRMTGYGPLVRDVELPQAGANPITISVQDPYAMLSVASEASASLSSLILAADAARASSPDEPWALAVYADEIGHNPLLPSDPRKTQCIYWTICELGAEALATENAWFITATIRSTLVDNVDSGMSHVFGFLLSELFFNSASGHDFAKSGIVLTLHNGKRVVLFLKLKVIVGDEKALKEILGAKGASGMKICACCTLVVKHETPSANLVEGYVRSTCLDMAKFGNHTNESIMDLVADLKRVNKAWAERRINTSKRDEIEKHYGYKHLENSLLHFTALNLPARDMIHYDHYHIFVVNGIFQKEIQGLLVFVSEKGFPVQRFSEFMEQWQFPRSVQNPHAMFANFSKNKDHLTCDGHVCNSSYSIIACFLESVVIPAGVCVDQCTSFLRLADVLDLLMNVNRGLVEPATLLLAIVAFLQAHMKAYDTLLWVPKHHLAMHLADQLDSLGMLICCNILEMRHQLVKTWTRDRFTRKSFEAGCIEEVTLQHLFDLQGPWLKAGLLHAHAPHKALKLAMESMFGNTEIQTSRDVRANGKVFVAGDYAYANVRGEPRLGLMAFHISVGDADPLTLTAFELCEHAPCATDNLWCKTYKNTFQSCMLDSNDLIASVSHIINNGLLSVLVPASVRIRKK